MIRYALPLFLCSSVMAQDLGKWEKVAVKTWSYPCSSKQPMFEGSGVIFQSEKGPVVLTSEHVIIQNSKEAICHEIQNDQIGLQKVTLDRVSYLKGMALLKPTDAKAKFPALPLEELNKVHLDPSDIQSVTAMGFPHGSENLQVLENGKVVTLESRRALIPGATKFGEFSGLASEFGNSGGYLIGTTKSGKTEYLGQLSHQILKREGGKGTAIVEMVPGQKIQGTDLTLGILNSDVKKWIEQGKSDPMDQLWKRNLETDGTESLDLGPFNFDVQPFDSKLLMQGGTDINGIGGADGMVTQTKKVIALSLDPEKAKSAGRLFQTFPFLKKWERPLMAGRPIAILQMAKRKSDGSFAILPVASIDQAMTLWMRERYEPIIFVGNINNMDDQFEQMRTRSVTVSKNAIILQKKFAADKSLTNWLERMKETVDLVTNGVAPHSEINTWIQDSPNWDQLYMEDFDTAVALRSDLQALAEMGL